MAADTKKVAVEFEAKLMVPVGVVIADLDGVMKGVTAVRLPERGLDVVYYDTTDLRLARSGITLRHREGEGGPAWTVELPAAPGSAVLLRREVTFDEPPGRVPACAADLVSATTRGRRLGVAARLSTRRVPVQLRSRGGSVLADVVEDSVVVSRGEQQAGQFREVEIEVFGRGRTGRGLLKAAVARLAGAGCVPLAPVPKLVRALGEQAARPPDVVVLPMGAHASLADLVRHAMSGSVAQLIGHDPGVRLGDAPEDLHQLRVASRRLRSDLRTFGPVLAPAPAARIRTSLAWLATEVGPARDADVLASRLGLAIAALPEADAEGASTLLGLLQQQTRSARAVMLEALRNPRYLRLLDDLVRLGGSPPMVDARVIAGGDPARVAARLARAPWRRLAAAASGLGANPSDSDLHRIRVLAKRCRYATEAVGPVIGADAAPFAEALAHLQGVLGEYHDTVVAEAWLREAATDHPASALAVGQLVAVEIARRAELRREWRAAWQRAASKKLRRWL